MSRDVRSGASIWKHPKVFPHGSSIFPTWFTFVYLPSEILNCQKSICALISSFSHYLSHSANCLVTIHLFYLIGLASWGSHGYCCSVTQPCPTLCNPMDYSTPGSPVLHHLLELVQTHVHWVGDAIQLSHPLFSCSLLLLSSIVPRLRVFSNELALSIRWPKQISLFLEAR